MLQVPDTLQHRRMLEADISGSNHMVAILFIQTPFEGLIAELERCRA